MKNTVLYPRHTTEDDIRFIVKDIIQYKLGIEEKDICDEADFQDDLGVDSLDLIELRMEIEKQFSIAITDEEAENLHTVGSIIICVKNKR